MLLNFLIFVLFLLVVTQVILPFFLPSSLPYFWFFKKKPLIEKKVDEAVIHYKEAEEALDEDLAEIEEEYLENENLTKKLKNTKKEDGKHFD